MASRRIPFTVLLFGVVICIAQLGVAAHSICFWNVTSPHDFILLWSHALSAGAAGVLLFYSVCQFTRVFGDVTDPLHKTRVIEHDQGRRYPSLIYILPFMAYGGLCMILASTIPRLDDQFSWPVIAHLAGMSATLFSAGLAGDEFRKLLIGTGAAGCARSGLYRIGVTSAVLVTASWLLETAGRYLETHLIAQRKLVLLNGLEVLLPVGCMLSGLKLCDLFSRSNAAVSARGKEPSIFSRVLTVVMILCTLLILSIRGGFIAVWRSGIDQYLLSMGYASQEVALVLFPTAFVIYVNRIRTNMQVDATPSVPRPLFPHLLIWVTIVAALTQIGALISTAASWPKWMTSWQVLSMCNFDCEHYDYIMAALLARELALMPTARASHAPSSAPANPVRQFESTII
jgi:hypothetical protein